MLKLYLSFMKLNYSDKHDKLFMRQTQRFLQSQKTDRLDSLDPVMNFAFTTEVLDRVKLLLDKFKVEALEKETLSEIPLLDSMTKVVIDAMYYCDLIGEDSRSFNGP